MGLFLLGFVIGASVVVIVAIALFKLTPDDPDEPA
jgi:hypothetical protein